MSGIAILGDTLPLGVFSKGTYPAACDGLNVGVGWNHVGQQYLTSVDIRCFQHFVRFPLAGLATFILDKAELSIVGSIMAHIDSSGPVPWVLEAFLYDWGAVVDTGDFHSSVRLRNLTRIASQTSTNLRAALAGTGGPYVKGGTDAGGADGAVVLRWAGGSMVYGLAGPYSWTAPAGVTTVNVRCIGGAGGGYEWAGVLWTGGGGAYAESDVSVTPGTAYAVMVGAGGATEQDGQTTTFGGATVVADYGRGGNGSSGAAGTAGASTGDVKVSGSGSDPGATPVNSMYQGVPLTNDPGLFSLLERPADRATSLSLILASSRQRLALAPTAEERVIAGGANIRLLGVHSGNQELVFSVNAYRQISHTADGLTFGVYRDASASLRYRAQLPRMVAGTVKAYDFNRSFMGVLPGSVRATQALDGTDSLELEIPWRYEADEVVEVVPPPVPQSFDVTDYGATGDGTTDDTAAIQACMDAAGSEVVNFPAGHYKVSVSLVNGYYRALEFANGGRWQLHASAYLELATCDASDYYYLALAQNKTGISIDGGRFVGDRQAHVGVGSEHGMNIGLISCNDVALANFHSSQACGDGVYVGGANAVDCTNIVGQDFTCDSNRRNGMSVVACQGGTFTNLTWTNNGAGTDPLLPANGLDLEPNRYYSVVDTTFTDCYAAGNGDPGISIYWNIAAGTGSPALCQRNTFINCTSEDNGGEGIVVLGDYTTVKDCTMTGGPVKRGGVVRGNYTTIDGGNYVIGAGDNRHGLEFEADPTLFHAPTNTHNTANCTRDGIPYSWSTDWGIFGYDVLAGNVDQGLNDYVAYARFALQETGNVFQITAWIENTLSGHAACNVRFGIYDDNGTGGYPGTLLGVSAPIAIADNWSGWVTDIVIANGLAAGDYILAVLGDPDTGGLGLIYTSTGGWFASDADTYSDGFKNPATKTTGSNARKYNIFATYTKAAEVASYAASGATLQRISVAGTLVNSWGTFGFTSPGGNYDQGLDDYAAYAKFALSEDGDVFQITVAIANTLSGHAACNIRLGIYDDDGTGGYPGTLLGTSAPISVADNYSDWLTAAVVANGLTAGNYILAAIGDTSAAGLALLYNSSGGWFAYDADTYSDGFKDPATKTTGANSRKYSIFASYVRT